MQLLFKKDEYFRDFLLTKSTCKICLNLYQSSAYCFLLLVINGERAAYHAPEFRPKITRTRSQILHDCANIAKPINNTLISK